VRAARGPYKMGMQTTMKRPQSSLLRRELEDTLREVDTALRAMGAGDHEPYAALWDDAPDVTLFGAWGPIEHGADAVQTTFEWVGPRFGDGELVPENVVVHMSGALACTIGFERGVVSVDGGPPQPMTLRTTHVYRYAGARWRLVHRHADFPPRDQREDRAA
jgi:ketosteroid isomerase-like protein